MSFLLDTDICSASLKGDRKVWQKCRQHKGQLHVSAVTAGVLFACTHRAKTSRARHQGLMDLLNEVIFHDVDRDVSLKFGEMRPDRLDRGQFTPEMDLLIAATTLVHGLTLVTHNVRDFASIPHLPLEDWLPP